MTIRSDQIDDPLIITAGSVAGCRDATPSADPARAREMWMVFVKTFLDFVRKAYERNYLVDPASNICSARRFSHACASIKVIDLKLRTAHYNSRNINGDTISVG